MDDKKMWPPDSPTSFENWAESLDRTANQMPDTQWAIEGAAEQLRTAAAQMRELDAENKRLREALRKIRDTSVTVARDMAREALKEEE